MGRGEEEKILVLVRMKPSSQKEMMGKKEIEDWECINRTSILFKRSVVPTAYTFDRVFGGDCSTRLVYEEGAKEIALSVVSGINASIFAYGQTSSGKTYTMIGITEYAVADIYDYIERHEERAFLLKFSAIEIYNEAVRDLLSTDNMPLRLLDDPEKGTIVEKLTEETLRDWRHLKELLSKCEAHRQTGETSLNETSSRSHQILRLTVESSAREFLGKGKSTALAASVNFVDLAGSERASQALSNGQRLKEGCHINRSLLTLGTVIRKLSKGTHGHVNYRDSKLTRILQPCLGGNARTAIICTLSPARSHVEQSKNTLLFATCAKEVTTNAQVNVVMSDKALVKHLQKELANLEIELRTQGSTATFDYEALLRKKDVQIEKLENEVRELTKQRELAQSQIEKLLFVFRNDQNSRQLDKLGHPPKWKEGNSCKDEFSKCGLADQSSTRNNKNKKVPIRKLIENDDDNLLYDEVSSSNISKFVRSVPHQHGEEYPLHSGQDSNDICKEVRCIEMDQSSTNNIMKSHTISNRGNERRSMLEQKIQDLQKIIKSLASPYADEQSRWDMEADMSSSRSLNLSRSRSCRANIMIGSSSLGIETQGQSEGTPLNSFERIFPGRPEGLQTKHHSLKFGDNIGSLSRYDSQTSVGTAFTESSRVENNNTSGDEDIPSVGHFVAGLKEMAKLQYETQSVGDQVQEMELKSELGTPSRWPLEFERQQISILELWDICNVSLVHRTYFFLLFNGDPMDSIYMEVEIRRLSFLKETFSKGNSAVEDGRILTPDSSVKALRRERETLSRLMYKRFSDEERKKIYVKWGISLDSKRRRFQLVGRLWSDAKDMNHIKESATLVAKLVRFLEHGQAPKEMFGLSFTPPHISRRSSGWKHSMASLL